MTHFSLKEIFLDDYQDWYAKNHSLLNGRSPFHHPAWLRAVARGSGYEVVFIGIFEAGLLAAVTPGFLKSIGPFRIFGSPLRGVMTPYLGPVGIPSIQHALSQVLPLCSAFAQKRWRAAYTEFSFRELSGAHWNGLGKKWEHGSWTSYSLDLTPGQEALWTATQTRFRRHVRKSERLGLKIVPMCDGNEYRQMQDETMSRRGTASWHSDRFFQGLFDEIPDNLIWTLAVEYQGEKIAAGIFLHDENEVHYLSGASRSEFRSLPTSYLLHWHVVVEAVQAGLKVYNLGGRPTESIDLFKKSLSPQLIRHDYVSEASFAVRYARDLLVSALPRLRNIKRLFPNRAS